MSTEAETTIPKSNKYPNEEDDIQFEQQVVDAIKKLPLEQRLQVIALNFHLLAKKQSDLEVGDQMEKIGQKYSEIQDPIMGKINQIIAGERAPVEEEIQEGKAHLTPEETEKIGESLTAEPFADYWHKVITSCVRFENDIFEADHPLLKKITKIENVPEKDSLNFTITFHFAENEYFENPSLSAKFFLAEDEVPEKIEGTDIKWKEGKDITSKTITKKKKNKKTGKKVPVQKVVEADSFFNLFKNLDPAPEGEEDDEEEANQELQKLQDRYDIAATIQEEILLYHLEYYLGLRKGDEDNDMMMPMGGEDFDDEDDVPVRIPGKKKGPK